jgi:hypothetical protein
VEELLLSVTEYIYSVSDVMLVEVQTAESLVLDPSPMEVEIDIAKLEYELPGCVQILAEQIEGGDEILLSAIYRLIIFVWNKKELPYQWKKSIIVPVHKKGDKTNYNKCRGI